MYEAGVKVCKISQNPTALDSDSTFDSTIEVKDQIISIDNKFFIFRRYNLQKDITFAQGDNTAQSSQKLVLAPNAQLVIPEIDRVFFLRSIDTGSFHIDSVKHMGQTEITNYTYSHVYRFEGTEPVFRDTFLMGRTLKYTFRDSTLEGNSYRMIAYKQQQPFFSIADIKYTKEQGFKSNLVGISGILKSHDERMDSFIFNFSYDVPKASIEKYRDYYQKALAYYRQHY